MSRSPVLRMRTYAAPHRDVCGARGARLVVLRGRPRRLPLRPLGREAGLATRFELDDLGRAAPASARDIEGEQQPLACRLNVAERGVERPVERVDDLAHRAPFAAAASAAT